MKEQKQKVQQPVESKAAQASEVTSVEVLKEIVTILWDWFGRYKAKPVTAAYLHAPTMLPGGQTEASLTQVKLPGIKLFWVRGEGLVVEYKGERAIIPAAGVKVATFDGPKVE